MLLSFSIKRRPEFCLTTKKQKKDCHAPAVFSFVLLIVLSLLLTVACSAPPVATPVIENPTLTTPHPTPQLVATSAPVVATVQPAQTFEPTATPMSTKPLVLTSVLFPTTAPAPTKPLAPTVAPFPTTAFEPTETVAPTATLMPEPPPLGARGNPVPLGQVVELLEGDVPHWAIVVSAANPDAYEELLPIHYDNDPPEPGNQFFMVRIELKYLGPDSAKFSDGYHLQAVGQSAVVLRLGCNSSHPDWFKPGTELFTGGAIEGWLCWTIPTTDAASLQLLVDRWFSDERVWFDLR